MGNTADTSDTVELVMDATTESSWEAETAKDTTAPTTTNKTRGEESKVTPTSESNQADTATLMEDVNNTVTMLLNSDTETETESRAPTADMANQDKEAIHETEETLLNDSNNNNRMQKTQESKVTADVNVKASPGETRVEASEAGSATTGETGEDTVQHAAVSRTTEAVDSLVTATSPSDGAQPPAGSLAAIALGVNIRRDGGAAFPKRRKMLATKTTASKQQHSSRPRLSVEERAAAMVDSALLGYEEPTTKPVSAPSTEGANLPPEKVYEGPPKRNLPKGWPPGWKEIRYKRMGGCCRGTEDSYWFSPTEPSFKLRSIKEVQRFLYAMETTNDPKFAYAQRKKGPTGEA